MAILYCFETIYSPTIRPRDDLVLAGLFLLARRGNYYSLYSFYRLPKAHLSRFSIASP
jgi:hypothetical protein